MLILSFLFHFCVAKPLSWTITAKKTKKTLEDQSLYNGVYVGGECL